MSAHTNSIPWPPYRVRARNISRDAGPSVHSDQVARSLGFKGALVAGRVIYSHLLHPLVSHFGVDFLARNRAQVTFLKPAYEGDPLTVLTESASSPGAERICTACARNGEQAEVARLETSLPLPFPAPNALAATALHDLAAQAPAPFDGVQREGSWEALQPGLALAAFPWTPSKEHNLSWCDEIGEALPLFREGEAPPLHPGLLPTATTELLHQQLAIRGWVHVSSLFLHHALLRAGQKLELRATPLEKWERKGRHFVKLYVAVVEIDAGDGAENARVLAEEFRTAIIKGE
ncbi:MAG: hypothetical protein O7G32_03490 [SAR324 cluster bacterium]|nr:hypothetical protein [SAR324 cluster bacterium]